MSDKARYEIEYKLLGERHTDLIEDMDARVVDVVQALARKHHVAVNEALTESGGLPLVPISDVAIHHLDT